MTDDMRLSEDDELLAAELALGLLGNDEAQAAEAKIAADPRLAEAYRQWQDYAVAMLAGPTVSPRPSLWPSIVARLPANDVAPAASSGPGWWRVGTLAASAAAVVLAVIAVQKPTTIVQRVPVPVVQPPAAPMVAVLTGKGAGVVTISFDRASGRMISATSGLDIGAHSPELWVIPADGKPRSLGVIGMAPGSHPAPASAMPMLAAGVTLAVSVEPLGGSPSGQPTGPVILTGKMAAA